MATNFDFIWIRLCYLVKAILPVSLKIQWVSERQEGRNYLIDKLLLNILSYLNMLPSYE